jgi:hypothetical protein
LEEPSDDITGLPNATVPRESSTNPNNKLFSDVVKVASEAMGMLGSLEGVLPSSMRQIAASASTLSSVTSAAISGFDDGEQNNDDK